jgi:hypothetical protein
MRISAYNDTAFIQLERRNEDGYDIFDVSAEQAGFSGRNQRVIMMGVSEFLQQLGKLEATRRGAVVLEGSEEFRLSVEVLDTSGHIWIGFRICRHVYQARDRTPVLTMEGGFEFDAEFVHYLIRDFRELLKDHQGIGWPA